MTDHSLRMISAYEQRHEQRERQAADRADRRDRDARRDRVSIATAVAGRSAVAVVAPRAGRVAPLTGKLARAIAGRSHRLYCRAIESAAVEEGGQPAPGAAAGAATEPEDFDEPILRSVLDGSRTVVTIASSPADEDAMTVIRGSDRALAQRLAGALREVGFAAIAAPPTPTDASPAELFNRSSGGGVELLLTRRMRRDLAQGFLRRRPLFDRYVAAVRWALAAEPATSERATSEPAGPAAVPAEAPAWPGWTAPPTGGRVLATAQERAAGTPPAGAAAGPASIRRAA